MGILDGGPNSRSDGLDRRLVPCDEIGAVRASRITGHDPGVLLIGAGCGAAGPLHLVDLVGDSEGGDLAQTAEMVPLNRIGRSLTRA